MKSELKSKVLASREFYDVATTIFVTTAGVALLTRWLNSDFVYYFGMIGYLTFAVLKRRNIDSPAAIAAERALRLDAARWRLMQAGEKVPIIEEVVRLRDAGRKIEAIKLYRQLRPESDLRAALDAVDLM